MTAGLYQAQLMAHAKNPYGAAAVPRGTETAEAFNPACGDDIRLALDWTPDEVLRRLAYDIRGCAVSRASASMTAQLLEGKTRAEIKTLQQDFTARLGHDGFDSTWGDFQAFNGIERYPARIHCAALVWQALEKAL